MQIATIYNGRTHSSFFVDLTNMVGAGVYGVEPGDQRAEADGGGGRAPRNSGKQE